MACGRTGHPDRGRGGLTRILHLRLAAIWAPKGTPSAIIAKLNTAVVETLADPAVRAGASPLSATKFPPREQQTPEALAALQKAEIEKWWPIIKAANIKPE